MKAVDVLSRNKDSKWTIVGHNGWIDSSVQDVLVLRRNSVLYDVEKNAAMPCGSGRPVPFAF